LFSLEKKFEDNQEKATDKINQISKKMVFLQNVNMSQ